MREHAHKFISAQRPNSQFVYFHHCLVNSFTSAKFVLVSIQGLTSTLIISCPITWKVQQSTVPKRPYKWNQLWRCKRYNNAKVDRVTNATTAWTETKRLLERSTRQAAAVVCDAYFIVPSHRETYWLPYCYASCVPCNCSQTAVATVATVTDGYREIQ